MPRFTESVVEEAALEWFEALGYSIATGPDIAPDTARSEFVEAYEQIASSMNTQSGINELESRTLTETRDALLPKILSGEVRVLPKAGTGLAL